MRKFSIILLVCISCLLAALFAKAQVKSKSFAFVLKRLLTHKVPQISVAKVAALPAAYTLLDTREKEEYLVSRLPNAIYAGYKDFSLASLKDIPKNKPIVVYCSIGKRSENIAEKLISEGFKNVSNLYGGIFEWVNQGNVVFDNQNNQTQNIHAYNRIWGRFLEKGKKVY